MDQNTFFGRQIRSGQDMTNALEAGMVIVRNLTSSRLLVGHEGWAIDRKGLTAFSIITEELLSMQENGLIFIDSKEKSPISGFISGPAEEPVAEASDAADSGETTNGSKKSTKKVKQPVVETQAEPEAVPETVTETPEVEVRSDDETSASDGNNNDNVDTASDSF